MEIPLPHIIEIGVMCVAVGGAWGVVKYKVKNLNDEHASFRTEIEAIKQGMKSFVNEKEITAMGEDIKTQLENYTKEIKQILFVSPGIPRYISSDTCSNMQKHCLEVREAQTQLIVRELKALGKQMDVQSQCLTGLKAAFIDHKIIPDMRKTTRKKE